MSVYTQVADAVKAGELIRPDRCEECGEAKKVVGHHDDYDRPLDVRWLCFGCHRRWHAQHGPGKAQKERHVTIQLPLEIHEGVVALAEREHRSIHAQIIYALERHVEDEKQADLKAAA